VDASTQARRLARLSADEIVGALHLERSPAPLRMAARASFFAISRSLGRSLARFDGDVASAGLARASAAVLEDLGATWRRFGETPAGSGPLVVVSNHPGAFDALALIAATGRDDLAVLAADRAFLRAMPNLSRHLIFVSEADGAAASRMRAVRRALRHLASGGALLHFGAGRIEPDPAFLLDPRAEILAPWHPGCAVFVRAAARHGGLAIPAVVAGVHSPKAKRALLTRFGERHGATTIAGLLQVTFRRYRDVAVTVRLGPPHDAAQLARAGDDAAVVAALRDAALALMPITR
jgi:putative hemolysin